MQDDHENPIDNDTTPTASGIDPADKPINGPGDRIRFRDFATPANGDPDHTEMGHTIHAQMGLDCYKDRAIRSAWAIKGKYHGGGALLILDPDKTTANGDTFAVSYHNGWDEYAITYAKRDGDFVDIIKEAGNIQADQLCVLFSEITGIQIPVVQFG